MKAQYSAKKEVTIIMLAAGLLLALLTGCQPTDVQRYTVHDLPKDRMAANDVSGPPSGPDNNSGWTNYDEMGDIDDNDHQDVAMAGVTRDVSAAMPNVYHLGVGDVLQVSVFQLLELNRDAVLLTEIDEFGRIYLPVLGRVRAAGLTVDELRASITDLLRQEFIRDPKVDVRVREYVSKQVMVLGAVRSPGPVALDADGVPLLDLICRIGGVGGDTAGTVEIIRNGYQEATAGAGQIAGLYQREQFPNSWQGEVVPLSKLFDGGNGRVNPMVYGGDVVYVAPSRDGVIYVTGAVRSPGTHPFRRPLTVLQAVASAGGFSRVAAEGKCKLVRALDDGSEEVVSLDVPKIRKGEMENLLLARNDLIMVPTDPVKAFFDGLDRMFQRGVQTAVQVNYDMGADMGVPSGSGAR